METDEERKARLEKVATAQLMIKGGGQCGQGFVP